MLTFLGKAGFILKIKLIMLAEQTAKLPFMTAKKLIVDNLIILNN